MVSVIVPLCNPGPYLGGCLASLKAQTCRDLELVLVDDGSSDGSEKECDRFAAENGNVRVLHTANQGPLLARREGMRAAKGDYLMFLDADDCLRPDAVQVVTDAIAESGADVICFGYSHGAVEGYEVDASTAAGLLPGRYQEGAYDAVRLAICTGSFNSLWNKAFRRDLADLDDDYEAWGSLRHGEDLFQLLPIIDAARSLRCLGEVLYFYRENSASSTHSYRTSRIDDLAVAYDRLCSYAVRWGADCVCEARRMACRHVRWALGDLAASDWGAAERLREAGRLRLFLERRCGECLPDALASLRLDFRLPLGLLVSGRLEAALRSVRYIDGLYRGVCRIAGMES